jgi:hypothetical protein
VKENGVVEGFAQQDEGRKICVDSLLSTDPILVS